MPVLQVGGHLRLVHLGEQAIVEVLRSLVVARQLLLLLLYLRGSLDLALIIPDLRLQLFLLFALRLNCQAQARQLCAKLLRTDRIGMRNWC